ncbi:TRAP transporter small permease [Alkalihalobacterium elongatum]|uniref:TRAP transporter small permease n=1 Tax=Alkalihalobacterium elongatum TaxID=2675466 RepID=UPI001C1FCA6A|nr:TRAP transporter small permease [Alkalihalobacterium elongatum]
MPAILKKSYVIYSRIKFIGLIISGICLFLMMVFIVADVLSRNILSKSIPGNYEIVRYYFMPLALFPGVAYAYGTGIFPRITMIVSKLSKKIQKLIVILLLFVELVLFSLVFYFGLQYGLSGVEEGLAFPAGGKMYPLYPFIFLVPIGFGMLIIEIIFLIIRNLTSPEPSLTVTGEVEEEVIPKQ